MWSIIVGLIVIAIGVLMVARPRWFLGTLGPQRWAEKFFGPGNETTAYQTIGLIVIIIGFLIVTNLVRGMIVWFLVPTNRM